MPVLVFWASYAVLMDLTYPVTPDLGSVSIGNELRRNGTKKSRSTLLRLEEALRLVVPLGCFSYRERVIWGLVTALSVLSCFCVLRVQTFHVFVEKM